LLKAGGITELIGGMAHAGKMAVRP
jgi:hypothetical protein